MNRFNPTRRRFLSQMSAGLGAGFLSNTLLLQQVLAADDYSGINDYKALVCVLLHGGNDAFNMFVPRSGNAYNSYQKLRGDLAVASNTLLPLDATDYGFHPNMPNLQQLFNSGKLAVMANTGNLMQPLSKAEFLDWAENGGNSVQVPPQLFSHSDQSYFMQTGYPPGSSTSTDSGWGGRMADLLAATNSNAYVPITMTLDGHSPWEAAPNTSQLALDYGYGIEGFSYLEADDWPEWVNHRSQTWEQLLALGGNSPHALERQLQTDVQRTRNRVTEVKAGLTRTWDAANNKDIFSTEYNADSPLSAQLRMVARMIYNHQQFGQKRQLFVVSIGGWDTHGSQADQHPRLLGSLDQGLHSFYQVLKEIGVEKQVTTFTLSEFGRTLGNNGDGTDHGWGTHHLVMGDAVQGGKIYGELPVLENDSDNDIGGALLPTTATDQYGATLANWLNISSQDLALVFPYINNFSVKDLGFMG